MANLDKWSMFLNNITSSVQCVQLYSEQLQKVQAIREEYVKDCTEQPAKEFLADDVMKYIALTSEVNNEISKIQDRYSVVLNESIEELLGFITTITYGDDGCLKWIEDGIALVLNVIEFNEKPYSLSCTFREFIFDASFNTLRNLQLTMQVETVIAKLRCLRNKINTKSNVGEK